MNHDTLIVGGLALACAAGASGQVILPTAQFRLIEAGAEAPPIVDTQTVEVEPDDYGSFDEAVAASARSALSGIATGDASQASEIGAASITGSGSFSATADTSRNPLTNGSGLSTLEFVFTVTQRTAFAINAQLEETGPCATTSLSIIDADEEAVVEFALPDDEAVTVGGGGLLDPGSYTIAAATSGGAGGYGVPCAASSGTFAFTLAFFAPGSCLGDTNFDAEIDVDDLNNVILDWGTDGTANGGDITGAVPGSPPDGVVNVNDLNAIIVNWGLCL